MPILGRMRYFVLFVFLCLLSSCASDLRDGAMVIELRDELRLEQDTLKARYYGVRDTENWQALLSAADTLERTEEGFVKFRSDKILVRILRRTGWCGPRGSGVPRF